MIKTHEFISVCLQLVKESAYIIKHVHEQQSFNKVQKEDNLDFATDADFKAQEGLKNFWPGLKIIGEEDQLPQENWKFSPEILQKNLLLPQYFQEQEFPIENTIVWIDPLDATLSYLKGNLSDVTILIGVSVNQIPYLGIIGQPYQKVENILNFDPIIYFSQQNTQKINYIYGRDINNQLMIPFQLKKQIVDENRFILCTTQHRLTDDLQKQIELMKPQQIVKVGGAGNKLLEIVKGKVDMYFYPKPNALKRWDTCAGEVFINNFGGKLTGLDGKSYIYSQDQDYGNSNGILATLNLNQFDKILSFQNKNSN